MLANIWRAQIKHNMFVPMTDSLQRRQRGRAAKLCELNSEITESPWTS